MSMHDAAIEPQVIAKQGVSDAEKRLHKVFMVIAGLTAGFSVISLAQLTMVPMWQRLWIAFLAANLLVWTGLVLGFAGLEAVKAIRHAKVALTKNRPSANAAGPRKLAFE